MLKKALQHKEHRILNKKCAIRKALNYARATQETKRLQSTKLYVSGFDTSTSESEVESFFGQFGVVDRVLYSVNPKTETFRGFCYVVMKDPKVYNKLLTKRIVEFGDREITIETAQSLKEVKAKRRY